MILNDREENVFCCMFVRKIDFLELIFINNKNNINSSNENKKYNENFNLVFRFMLFLSKFLGC